MSLPVLSSSLQPLVISESMLPSQPYTTTTSPLSTDASPQPSSRTVKCLQTSNLSESTHGENSECRQFKPDASPQPTSKTIKSSPFTKPTQIKTTKLSASSQNPDASTNYSLRAMIQEHIVSSPMPKQTKVETTKQPLPSNKSNSVSVRQNSGISTSLVSTSNIPDIDFNSTLPTVEEQTGITSPGASTNFKYVCPHCNKSYRLYASLYKRKKKRHAEEVGGQIKCEENGCSFTRHYIAQLGEHLASNHHVNISQETITFSNSKGNLYT